MRPPILAIHGHFAPLPKKQAEHSSADPGRNMSSSSYPLYSVFWDDTPIVTDRAHGVVNGRGIGRYLTTISNPSTNGGPMSIDNLLVTATEAEPIPAVLAFLNQPTQGNPGQVLSPSAEVAVVNAFDEPIIDGTTVTLEIASGPVAQLSGASATTTNGVAHFDTLRIDTPGIYRLRARSGDAMVVAGTILTIYPLPILIFANGFEGNTERSEASP